MKNSILALTLALLLTAPMLTVLSPTASADDSVENIQDIPVQVEERWNNTWYKFETPLITLIFPAGGKKPMFLWWYTKDNSTIYVVKFKGVIENLLIDLPYYRHRFHADNATINATLWKDHVEPRLRYHQEYWQAKYEFWRLLSKLHSAYLPFSACNWTLTGPILVKDENVTYWSFNFTLIKVYGHPRLTFAEQNIHIRCRFYNTTTTEVPDPAYSDYNYTVAAGQLKFDFVVSNWKWNIDAINNFLKNYKIPIPVNKTGLTLWINMASIKLEDLSCATDEVRNQAENQVEAKSQMSETVVHSEVYRVDKNETSQDEKPVQATLQLRERFRERIRLHFARGTQDVPVGFLEFVPWARLLNETGGTEEIVNVTASYIAAGGHLRLFVCYPYFGNYTLEHDPTIGLTSAPAIPEMAIPRLLLVLIGATIIIGVAVAAVKLLKKPVNVLAVK